MKKRWILVLVVIGIMVMMQSDYNWECISRCMQRGGLYEDCVSRCG